MIYTKIVEFENRLLTHQGYNFKRYNQLKTVLTYLKSYFDNGGVLTDRQTQLNLTLELEDEIERLISLRYSEDKDADFILHVNSTLRIVGIMKDYIPESILAKNPVHKNDGVMSRIKQVLIPSYENYSPFDVIFKVTTTWAQ